MKNILYRIGTGIIIAGQIAAVATFSYLAHVTLADASDMRKPPVAPVEKPLPLCPAGRYIYFPYGEPQCATDYYALPGSSGPSTSDLEFRIYQLEKELDQ